MYRLYLTLLILLLFGTLSSYAQTAGPDKFMCAGGTVEIGEGTLCAGCCANWVKLNGPYSAIADPKQLVTAVNAPGQYALTITQPTGNNLSAGIVTVNTATLDIQIFDPKVFTGGYVLIPDSLKETEGAQTFVNYDSDDNDADFDLADLNIAGGDDEFIKIRIELKVNGLPPTTIPDVILKEATSIPNSIRYWLSSDKVAGEYFVGTPISTVQTMPGGFFVEVWVEGIVGHTVQKGIKIYAESIATGCKSDNVSITILDIDNIEWISMGNGYTPDGKCNGSVLDVSSIHGTVKNYRVFVDAVVPTGKQRTVAGIQFNLTVNPVRKVRFYFMPLDIDDPSTNTQYVDPNDLGISGVYPISSFIFSSENDNRYSGAISIDTFPGLAIFNLASSASSTLGSSGGASSNYFQADFVPSHKFAVFKHPLSIFPGDNFRCGAFVDRDFVDKFRNYDKEDTLNIVFNPTMTVKSPINQKLCSDIITCWRTIHMESDWFAGGSYDANYPYKGGLIDFVGSRISATQEVVIGSPSLSLNDPSTLSVSVADSMGRFQGGQLFLDTTKLVSIGGKIQGQSSSKLFYSSPQNLIGSSGAQIKLRNSTDSVSLLMFDILKAGSSFKLLVSNPLGVDLTRFHTASIYKGIPMPILSFGNGTHIDTIQVASLSIPIVVRDDDRNPASIPTVTPTGTAQSIYNEAYYNIAFDWCGNSSFATPIPFRPYLVDSITTIYSAQSYLGMTDSLTSHHCQCKGAGKEARFYWTAHVVNGWEHAKGDDFDPNFDPINLGTLAIAPAITADTIINARGGETAFIACESVWDFGEDLSFVLAHELGHLLGLSHGDSLVAPNPHAQPFMGLMNPIPSPYRTLIPLHQHMLRSRSEFPRR